MAEPTTTLTDYLLGALALVLGLRLAGLAPGSGEASRWLWAAGFLALALGAALGGTSHGFGGRLAGPGRARLWTATLLVVIAGNALLAAAIVTTALVGAGRRLLLAALAAQLVLFALAVVPRPAYRLVVVDSVVSLGLVVAVTLWALFHGPAPWAPWVLAGACIAALAAVVQAFRLAPHPRFNHNDLYHVLQGIALVALYRGALVSTG
jgi:hypothetical protein